MEAKDIILKSNVLLSNNDWDEGGGYRPESVNNALKKQAVVAARIGRLDGIREVVEWVRDHKFDSMGNTTFRIVASEWQAKLKEWGD